MRITLYRGERSARESALPIVEVDEHLRYELFIDQAGAPAWPVLAGAERAALDRAVELFGARSSSVAAKPGDVGDRAGEVVGIGDVEDEVSLYAHLTRRYWSTIDSARELSYDRLPEVVVLLSDELDHTLVRFLVSAPLGETTTGIIWADSRDALRRQVLVRSAAAALNGPVRTRRIDLASRSLGGDANSGSPWFGDDSSQQDIRSAAAEGAGLLSVSGHGNGSGFRLPAGLAGCRADRPPDVDPLRSPECVLTGYCFRTKLSVAESWSTGRLLAPEAFASRVLVVMSCHAAFVGSGAVDARWSMLPPLLANPRIGAVIATSDVLTHVPGMTTANLQDFLAAGTPVGKALAAFHRTPRVENLGVRLLLFGDPNVRAAPAMSGQVLARDTKAVQAPAARHAAPANSVACEVELLRTVAHTVEPDWGDRALATSRAALSSLERYEALLRRGGSIPAGIGATMRADMLAHIGTLRAKPYTTWIGHAAARRSSEHVPCPHCGWPLRPLNLVPTMGGPRTLINCPQCGDAVLDQPVGDDWSFAVTGPVISLSGRLPTAQWSAAIFLVPAVASKTQTHCWPAGSDGRPVPRLEIIPDRWPLGPTFVRVALLTGTSLSMASLLTRAPAPTPTPAPPHRSAV
jgi:hypothetical protein